jgi:prevent-host-death family protein
MRAVSIQEAGQRLAALARDVENGETVVVTRDGRPVFSMVPHRQARGLRLDAVADLEHEHGIEAIVTYVADDFDAPLPEDFLLRRLD